MSRIENIETLVEEFPFEREPTYQAITNLRTSLEEKDWRRLKRMRRTLEQFLRKRAPK